VLCAYAVAEDERVCLPAMVSYDGFILSHASEPVTTISQEDVDVFLPPPGPKGRPILDPDNPVQFGEVLFPDWYPDYEYKKHRALTNAVDVLSEVFEAFAERFGRRYAPVEAHLCEDAEVVIVGIGSMMQTALATAEALREAGGPKVGVINLRVYRPFPESLLAAALSEVRGGEGPERVLVLDRDIGYGSSGMVYPDVTRALYHEAQRPAVLNFVIGTGGKDITPARLERCLDLARDGYQGQSVFWPDARGPREGLPFTEGVEV
jgi:pyruvate ferredoxin oxidoreductase alpha subunit